MTYFAPFPTKNPPENFRRASDPFFLNPVKKMYLRNVGIFVKDLEGARAFFESYFGAKVLKTYDNPEKN